MSVYVVDGRGSAAAAAFETDQQLSGKRTPPSIDIAELSDLRNQVVHASLIYLLELISDLWTIEVQTEYLCDAAGGCSSDDRWQS